MGVQCVPVPLPCPRGDMEPFGHPGDSDIPWEACPANSTLIFGSGAVPALCCIRVQGGGLLGSVGVVWSMGVTPGAPKPLLSPCRTL